MRNASIAVIIASLFAAGFIVQDKDKETHAAPQPEYSSVDDSAGAAMERILERLEVIEQRLSEPSRFQPASTDQGTFYPLDESYDTQFVSHEVSDVSAGDCGAASAYSGRRWTPIRNVASRWQSRRSSSGRWYPGKNLGRLFGRRR